MMMKRKLEAAFQSTLTVSCLCGLSIASVHADVVSPPKNFIVIFADDFGYGDLGCYRELYQGGDDRSLAHEYTPNLDRLGQQGVRFMQAYTASWCAPARQNLLSGRWCNRADNVRSPWLGKQLRDLGYSTCFVGKSHGNNSSAKVLNANPDTAEYNDGFFMINGMRKFYLRKGETFPRRVGLRADPFVAKGGEYLTDVFTDFSVDFIQRSAESEQPFCLYLAYNAPHSPLDGKLEDLQTMFPGEFDGIEEDDWAELLNASGARHFKPEPSKRLTGVRSPAAGWSAKTSPAFQRMKELGAEKFIQYNFAALVYGMDRGIGKIMDTLKEAGVDENTVVIFTSDNGSIMGSNYPLTGDKSSHFEGGVRVPMIFWSKSLEDSAAKGRIVEELCPTTDIATTLVGMAEQTAQPDFPFDGINLWPYLESNTPIPDDQVFYFASDTSQFYKANGLYRESLMRPLSKEEQGSMSAFGATASHDRIFNAVYIKGKEKLVYWSTLDESARGAVYKQLPTDARNFENPVLPFKEQTVVAGEFPESDAGQKLLKDFVEYTSATGPGELMHAAVFHSNGNHDDEKRAREYVQDLP
jgi:arylsulfatase A-like enzyme